MGFCLVLKSGRTFVFTQLHYCTFEQTISKGLNQNRCNNVGYLINSICIQKLLHSLDFEIFIDLMKFISEILRIACNSSVSNDNLRKSNAALRKQIADTTNDKKRHGKSKSSRYRNLQKIDSCFSENAKQCNIQKDEFKQQWLSRELGKNTKLFDDNDKFTHKMRQDFIAHENQLWKDYKSSKERKFKQTFAAVANKSSLNDLHKQRVAVSECSINNMQHILYICDWS